MPTVSLIKFNQEGTPETSDSPETYEVEAGELLFDELEMQGKVLPHGCLAGSCGSCRIIVTEGAQNLSAPRAIETDTLNHLKQEYREKKGEGFLQGELRLACRARVQGDITCGPIS